MSGKRENLHADSNQAKEESQGKTEADFHQLREGALVRSSRGPVQRRPVQSEKQFALVSNGNSRHEFIIRETTRGEQDLCESPVP